MSVIIKNEMFIKIQLFSFHCCCCCLSFLSILIACLPLYPLLMSCTFFSSLFRPPTKIIIVIKQSFTHNLSMLNVVGLFFPSDVNYTYSISIFLLSRSSTTDNTYFHFLVQFTKAAAMENY